MVGMPGKDGAGETGHAAEARAMLAARQLVHCHRNSRQFLWSAEGQLRAKAGGWLPQLSHVTVIVE
jgi:hypothetical protein